MGKFPPPQNRRKKMSSKVSPTQPPKWVSQVANLVTKHWTHHGQCNHVNITSVFDKEDGCWHVYFAPVLQEIYGGEKDGKKVWTGFQFEASDFLKRTGVYVEDFAVISHCEGCQAIPQFIAKGKFKGHRFFLHVFLEPASDAKAVEVIDILKEEIRDIPEGEL